MMTKRMIVRAVSAALAGAVMASGAFAEDSTTGPFGFEPIDSSASSAAWDPTAPWKLPEGFSQSVVSDETNLNIYDGGRDDWHDMNTVNETGMMAGRYMYRTHEVRTGATYTEGGAVSVVDLKTGETKVIAQSTDWTALDGIVWTPWGTVLFAEETTGGKLLELVLDKKDPMSGTVYDRPAVGRLAHEGIAVGPDGAVYVVDEHRGLTDGSICGATPCGGSIYKFVPHKRGDLSSGDLYVLGITAGDTFEGIGQGAWLGPIDPANARVAGSAAGGQSYQRPEDLEIIANTLYVAVTEGTRDAAGDQLYDGRVIAIDLNSLLVTDFVKPGVNIPVEISTPGNPGFQSGLDNPDNLAQSPDGKLIIVEDNVPSDIWFVGKDHDKDGSADATWLFGSLSDPSAEGTGIYFGKDSKTLYVNIQHSAAPDGDGTWAITKE